MPLLDHFRPPLSRTHPWRGFHGAWAAAIARLLNDGVLPAGFYAVPFLDRDGPFEIDVAALHEPHSESRSGDASSWQPAAPGLAVAVDWAELDDIHVDVYHDGGDPKLAAAIELVSPSNKDRPQARATFAAKCAEYLRRGCGLVVVDVVTTRRANLVAELFSAFDKPPPEVDLGPLAAISYRSIGRNGNGQLLAWPVAIDIGQPLPTLPLWLGADLSVPLDLELSHTAACNDLRI